MRVMLRRFGATGVRSARIRKSEAGCASSVGFSKVRLNEAKNTQNYSKMDLKIFYKLDVINFGQILKK